MNTAVDRFNRAYASYNAAMKVLGASFLAVIIVVMTMQIVYRYFLSGSLVWAEEFTRCLLVWICFLFLGVAYQRGEVASVELIDRLPRRLRAMLMFPAMIVTLIFIGIIAYFGLIYANQNYYQTVPGLNILLRNLTGNTGGVSIYWMYISVPIGMVLLAIHIAFTSVHLLLEAFGAPARSPEA